MNPNNNGPSGGGQGGPTGDGQDANRPSYPANSRPAFINDIRPQPARPSFGPAPRPANPQHVAPKPLVAPEPVEVHKPVIYDDTSIAASQPADPAVSVGGNSAPLARNSSKGRQGLRDMLSVFGVLASALLLAICLISFVFQSYQVDGPSMQTTLQNRDHLIVWKVPRTIAKITHHAYIPHRGDVIVFDEPNLAQYSLSSENKQLIKRVIGLPGDHVVIKDGVLTVYNSDHPDGFDPDKTLPYGNVITTTPGNVDVTVGEGQVFACGDNRTNSLDSRVFGPVDASNIVGKLAVRVLPLNSFKTF